MANNEVVPSIEFVWLYMATWKFPPFVSPLLSGFAFWYWTWYRITKSYQPSNNCGYWYVAHIKLSTHYIPVYRISAVLVLCLSFSEGSFLGKRRAAWILTGNSCVGNFKACFRTRKDSNPTRMAVCLDGRITLHRSRTHQSPSRAAPLHTHAPFFTLTFHIMCSLFLCILISSFRFTFPRVHFLPSPYSLDFSPTRGHKYVVPAPQQYRCIQTCIKRTPLENG